MKEDFYYEGKNLEDRSWLKVNVSGLIIKCFQILINDASSLSNSVFFLIDKFSPKNRFDKHIL